tara:strand:- start:670 stop:1539 length:870 start_codon:yes stop_codon:yes gene_type:complete
MLIKLAKIIFSILIIVITLKVIFSLTSNLTIDIDLFLKEHYGFILFTIVFQIIGVILSSLRWQKAVQFFSNNKNLMFSSFNYLNLTSRANIINNFIPSIIAGDVSKLISPNKKKKKEEIKFIVFDRLIGFFTLGHLGLISMIFLGLLNSNYFLFILSFEIFIFFIFYKSKLNLFKKNFNKVNSLNFSRLIIISFLSQVSYSLSLFVQLLGLKNYESSLNDYFISLFLNFVGMFPFSINGWGIREWSANKIAEDISDSNNIIIASIVFGVCISISNILIYFYTNHRKIRN